MVANTIDEYLIKAINESDWVIGALNFDEDLHFSSYYLRASLPSVTAGLYPGYSQLLSFYHSFNERYYLLKDECIHNAKEIVAYAKQNIGWLHDVLREIRKHCNSLWSLFCECEDIDQFRELSNNDLLKIYLLHHETHTELYKWARLPEALDRGVSYFTNYLSDLTKEAIGNREDLVATFNVLTQPVNSSVLSESLDELTDIAKMIQDDKALCDVIINSPQKARMVMPAAMVDQIMRYHNKWKYLNYHGYGERSLGDVVKVIDRIAIALAKNNDNNNWHFIREQLEVRREERDTLLDKLGFSPEYRQFFELYSEIGSAKLLRRYTQLRNFYYLDLMISEIARRLKLSEWQIRNMLPEEVIFSLKNGQVSNEILRRSDYCLYYVINGDEGVHYGTSVMNILRNIEASIKRHYDKKILKGVVACRGKTTGTCKIVIRAGENISRDFREGDILVSHSTDPDLLNILKVAGAVLTEQGGVTSHAALICRELGVPAIVGISGLLNHVADGDTLEVDAQKGTVRIVEAASDTPNAIITFVNAYDSMIGGKAHGLIDLVDLGCRVPDFILFNTEIIRQLLVDNNSLEIDRIIAWIKKRLRLIPGDKLAVRSSSIEEDNDTSSLAGQLESFLDIDVENLADILKDFLSINDELAGGQYIGSIIIQRMLQPDSAGVCITKDYRLSDDKSIIVEAKSGSNVLITQGRVRPTRFFINRETKDIRTDRRSHEDITLASLDLRSIVEQCLQIEDRFACPVDVEWAFTESKLFILQARPVVFTGRI